MSESLSGPWIRDYVLNVAETHGALLHKAPVLTNSRRVQLTDFLTYREDSYVWAWISDKHVKISARISKSAVDCYKRSYNRNVFDCRFDLVFISSYRLMFSPRPLGPSTLGNTSVSHISLEIDNVTFLGNGGHLFGDPRDLELDEKMKEWVHGLRQDGGGGNILKLRKQQELAQIKKPLPPAPSPVSVSLYAPISQYQFTKATGDTTKSKSERSQDFQRTYTKQWRAIENDSGWKYLVKPTAREQSNCKMGSRPHMDDAVTECSVSACPQLDTASRPESYDDNPSPYPLIPPRTPPQRQGTPTDWSLSRNGSPVAPDEANIAASGDGTTSHLLPDTEGNAAVNLIASDIHIIQPPMPAQCTKHSSLPHSSPVHCISPEAFTQASSQQLPRSSPPPPSSSLSIPPSSFPTSGFRRNIQRKVPHPGSPLPLADPMKQGPVQILVPNSDGTGSSQIYSQSQPCQFQPPGLPSSLPSCLTIEFKPGDASTPKPSSTTKSASRMFADSLGTHGDVDKRGLASTSDKSVNVWKQQGPGSTRPPVLSAPKIEVLEVGTSDTEEEIVQSQLMCSTAQAETTRTESRDARGRIVNGHHESGRLPADDTNTRSIQQGIPLQHPTPTSVMLLSSHGKQATADVADHSSAQSPERPGSRGSMHSLFSLEGEKTISSQDPDTSTNLMDKDQEKSAADTSRHDPETWKEPSFIGKHKGKARAVEGLDPPRVKTGKKREQTTQHRSPSPKRVRVSSSEARPVMNPTTIVQHRDPDTSKRHSSDRHSSRDIARTVASSLVSRSVKPRLANFVVDFERISLGRNMRVPRLDFDKDIKSTLLRTGRIRTLGDKAKNVGSVYISSPTAESSVT